VQSTRIFRKIYLDIRARAKVALAARRKREADQKDKEDAAAGEPGKRKKGRSDYSIADYSDILNARPGGLNLDEDSENPARKTPVPRGNVRGSVRVGTVQDMVNEKNAPKLDIMASIDDVSAPPSPRRVAAPETPKSATMEERLISSPSSNDSKANDNLPPAPKLSPEQARGFKFTGTLTGPLTALTPEQASGFNFTGTLTSPIAPVILTPDQAKEFNFTGTLTGPLPPIPTLTKDLNSNSLRDLLAHGDGTESHHAPAPPEKKDS
jgi:hypothetical protein